MSFVNLPTLLVSGDGRVFTPGAQTEVYPGPLLSPMYERSITEAGIEKILKLADDAALLRPAPDYTLPADGPQVTDAPDTVVMINVNGKAFEHRAYALGMFGGDGSGSEQTPARENLFRFVTLLADVAKVAGAANVGKDEVWLPDRFRFQATVVDPTQWTDPAPNVVEWPTGSGVVLADSAQCAVVGADAMKGLFDTATQLTFFQEEALVYQIAVVGVLPGAAVC